MSEVLKSKTHLPKSPVRWRNLCLHGTLWVSSEIILGLIGLDTLADYGEFLMQGRAMSHVSDAIAAITTLM